MTENCLQILSCVWLLCISARVCKIKSFRMEGVRVQ